MMLKRIVSLWFGLRTPVGRRAYALSGFGLMLVKYGVDAWLVHTALGEVWTPLHYLSPLYSTRQELIRGMAPSWLIPVMVAWTIPFIWIGTSMTMRRAVDAGLSAATAMLFFVPVGNYLWMLALCVLPSENATGHPLETIEPTSPSKASQIIYAVWPAALLGVVGVLADLFVFKTYGAILFTGIPVAMGFIAGLRSASDRIINAIVAGQLAVVITGGALLLFALEGVICLLMAAVPASALALLGSFIGVSASRHRVGPSHVGLLVAALPLLMAMESAAPGPPLREVISTVEIDAPPEQVWPNVVGFSELPRPNRLVFKLGIAYPMRARIEGGGVGAVRYCEFSTGPFVEPITVWDAPHRLAFDVASQPPPMHETSPYQVVRAPHLVRGLVSERGEFRLVPLPGGRTRLEGSTWYRVDMAPQPYWGFLADELIHDIHERVLDHVKQLSEHPVR